MRLSRDAVRGVVASGRPSKLAATPKRREKDVQAAILSALRAHGIPAWKVGTGTFRSTYKGRERWVQMGQKGMADIIGVEPTFVVTDDAGRRVCGRFLAIEVKAPGKQPTLEQDAFLHTVRQAGGLAFVAHSCEEVAKELGWT